MKNTTHIDANSKEAYLDKVNEITQFFSLSKDFGLFFCSCSNFDLRREVNHIVIERLAKKSIHVVEIFLADNEIEVEAVPTQLKRILENDSSINGIIINNLDFLIDKFPEFVSGFNQSRDVLTKLEIPMLFWINVSDISTLAIHAQDIFSFRSISTIQFDDIEYYQSEDRLTQRFSEEFRSKEDYEKIRLRIEILERQLKEAEDNNYPIKSLINNIVIPLFNNYQGSQIFDKSIKLFKKYEQNLDDNNIKHLELKLNHYGDANDIERVENITKQLINFAKESKNELTYAFSLEKIAKVFAELELTDKALFYQKEALDLLLKHYDENNPILSNSYNNIGILYSRLNQLDLSEKHFIKLLEISKKDSNNDFVKRAIILNNLGTVYRNNGEYKMALKYFQSALDLSKKIYDNEHPNIAISLFNIANTYMSIGDFEKAEKNLSKSIKIKEKVLNPDDQEIAKSYNYLAIILSKKGKFNEAIKIMDKCIEQQNYHLGKNNLYTGFSYNNLAQIYFENNKIKGALNHFNQAIKIFEQNSMEHLPEYQIAKSSKQNIENEIHKTSK